VGACSSGASRDTQPMGHQPAVAVLWVTFSALRDAATRQARAWRERARSASGQRVIAEERSCSAACKAGFTLTHGGKCAQ
jgi:hypothetical protein